MFVRKFAVAAAVAVFAGVGSAQAQQRGTLELGAFTSSTSFHSTLGMSNGLGAGGRVGMFVWPRLSLEIEGSGTSSDQPNKAHEVNVGVYAARVTGVPLKVGRVSVLVGAGADYIDSYLLESYGFDALVGAKVAITDYVALRVDGVRTFMGERNEPNAFGTNTSLRLGFSVYRHPRGINTVTTVTNTVFRDVPVAAAPQAPRPDSVSAAETRRLRAQEAGYQALRDSLDARPTMQPASAASAATMREMIYFQNDRSDLSDAAQAILADKLAVFRSNPTMRISVVGFASQPGSSDYNMALGLRRAEAAKAYLVSRGIDASRIEIATRGEGQLVVEGPGEAADAMNRRGQFSLLIADGTPRP